MIFIFDVIRGNASEIAALVEADNTSHGIDAGKVPNQVQIAETCARCPFTTCSLNR